MHQKVLGHFIYSSSKNKLAHIEFTRYPWKHVEPHLWDLNECYVCYYVGKTNLVNEVKYVLKIPESKKMDYSKY